MSSVSSAVRVAALRPLQILERGFDRAFDAAGNPWRHLGALGFYLFWIVAASGIYLYIFFDVSVEGAHRSVEALTHEQWYAGGVMRSLHRYASDALVIVVALHLVREFLRRRYAGFRWFSWLTGVPLLALVLASGIGGYWLVWDELAQFIAITTTEWLDWLSLFGEPLARNFLTSASLSSRFFTLLVFLHIGIPLALLLGMFIHVERVNHADTHPARVLGWGALCALLVLSLAAPAVSMPPADLARMPQRLDFDWFYLFAYPLIYAWSPAAVWALGGVAAIALAALPLIDRSAVPAARVDIANCNGCARCFDDCPYAAVAMQPRVGGKPSQQHAVVHAGLCASCGICAGACPSSTPFRTGETLVTGIDMPHRPINALREALERAVARAPASIVVFRCEHAARIDEARHSNIAAFDLLCLAMLPPSFIDYALREGARGVLLIGCREGECEFRLGARWAAERLAAHREPRLRASVPRARLRAAGLGPGEEVAASAALEDFQGVLRGMASSGEVRRPSVRRALRLGRSGR